MKRIAILVFSLAALGASACGKKKEEAKPTAGSGSAPVAGSADTGSGSAAAGSNAMAGSGAAMAGSNAAGSADATAEVDVPTEVDFEGEAAAKIDEKNLEAQLKAVEAELAR